MLLCVSVFFCGGGYNPMSRRHISNLTTPQNDAQKNMLIPQKRPTPMRYLEGKYICNQGRYVSLCYIFFFFLGGGAVFPFPLFKHVIKTNIH